MGPEATVAGDVESMLRSSCGPAGPGLGASSAEGPIEQRAMVIKVKRGVFITTIQVIIIIIQLEVITLCILSCRATVICIVKQLATANYW